MRCQYVETDLKYEVSGRKFFGNFMALEEVKDSDEPGLLLLAKSAKMDQLSKRLVDRVNKKHAKAADLVWMVSVDLSVIIVRWPVQRPEVLGLSQYTSMRLPKELWGNSAAEILKELQLLTEHEEGLNQRVFSRLPHLNGVIENRIKLRENPFGNIYDIPKRLEDALEFPRGAEDDALAMLFIAGRSRAGNVGLRYTDAMKELKQRHVENFRDDNGVFSTYHVSSQELTARKSRAAALLKKFLAAFPADYVLAGVPGHAENWEQKVNSFIADLSDDELCELLLAFWMTGIPEDARLKMLVMAVESRRHNW